VRPDETSAQRVRACFVDAVRGFDLADRVEAAVRAAIDPRCQPVVLAIGKSAAIMLAGALHGIAPREIVVARPRRALPLAVEVRAEITARGATLHEFATGHPIPDDESVAVARCAMRVLERAESHTPVVVLLSGGASASICLPRGGLALAEYARAVKDLLAAGLPIESVNALRGRLDATKHGGLAACARGEVYAFVASDVLGDDARILAAVGSGPTVVPAERDLDRELLSLLPERVRAVARSLPSAPRTRGAKAVVVARPHDLRHAVEARLVEHFAVEPLPDATGDVEELALRYRTRIATLDRGRACIAIGEPTVRLPEKPGRGGRAGRLALLVADAAAHRRGCTFLAAASDGVDGESGHAGAVVDSSTFRALEHAGFDIAAALRAFDDAPLHEASGAAIDLDATGLNLLDLHVLARR
jgi:hydroxypyruvate reductase